MQKKEAHNRQTYSFLLQADYSQFYLQDDNAKRDLSEKWTEQAWEERLALAPNTIGVHTASFSNVLVEVEVLDQEPSNNNYVPWDHITECSMDVPSGKIVIAGCTDYFPEVARIIVIPACYRARIFYGSLEGVSEDRTAGGDHYKIVLWPRKYAEAIVIKRFVAPTLDPNVTAIDSKYRKFLMEVYADHYGFYIQDEELSRESIGELLETADRLDTRPGTIKVDTACYDNVPVEMIVQATKPADESFAEWNHVAEASIEVPSGNLYLVEPMTDYNKNKLICVIPGGYRARIHWAGIEVSQDNKELGEEYYKIIIWPEEYKPIQVLKGHRKDALLQNFGVDREVAQKIFTELEAQYGEETRHYHTGTHIKAMLDLISYHYYELSNPLAVHLAIWFHDVIYDTRAKDNEEKSAEFAEKVLGEAGLPEGLITRVKELVLATKNHQAPPDDLDCQLFLDCDLAILGTPKDTYDEYAKNIRLEYSWVAEEDYRRGRKQVLEKFLQRDRIFFSEAMYNAHETQARRNLARELASLG